MIKVFPILPIWLMAVICIGLIVLIFTRRKKNIIRAVMVMLLFVINLRIMYSSQGAMIPSTDLDVLFVIDSTISMNAEDYGLNKDTRLSAVKSDCAHIVEQLGGSSFSIIQFDNSAQVLIPYVNDAYVVVSTINTISPVGSLYANGSSLNVPYTAMEKVLNSSKSNANGRARIVFFISDGEVTDTSSSLQSYAKLSKLVDGGAVLGYGTDAGGRMKSYTTNWNIEEKEPEYITYYDGTTKKDGISKIDEGNLKKIASDLGIDYIHMTNQSAIDGKLNQLKNTTVMTMQIDEDVSSFTDTYYWFVIPFAILALIDLNLTRRKNI